MILFATHVYLSSMKHTYIHANSGQSLLCCAVLMRCCVITILCYCDQLHHTITGLLLCCAVYVCCVFCAVMCCFTVTALWHYIVLHWGVVLPSRAGLGGDGLLCARVKLWILVCICVLPCVVLCCSGSGSDSQSGHSRPAAHEEVPGQLFASWPRRHRVEHVEGVLCPKLNFWSEGHVQDPWGGKEEQLREKGDYIL